MPFHAYQSPYQLHNDTIKEDIENEEHNDTKKMTGKKTLFGHKAPHEINEDIA